MQHSEHFRLIHFISKPLLHLTPKPEPSKNSKALFQGASIPSRTQRGMHNSKASISPFVMQTFLNLKLENTQAKTLYYALPYSAPWSSGKITIYEISVLLPSTKILFFRSLFWVTTWSGPNEKHHWRTSKVYLVSVKTRNDGPTRNYYVSFE